MSDSRHTLPANRVPLAWEGRGLEPQSSSPQSQRNRSSVCAEARQHGPASNTGSSHACIVRLAQLAYQSSGIMRLAFLVSAWFEWFAQWISGDQFNGRT